MIALIGLTAAFEWAAVVVRAHASDWNARTALLVGGLVLVSGLTVATIMLLAVGRGPRGSGRAWRHAWLGDVALAAQRVP